MRIAITGASGLIGSAAGEAFARAGWDVTRVVRAPSSSPGRVAWDPAIGRIDAAGLDAHDVVLHAAGEPIAGIWTEARKRRIEQSRVRGTDLLARTLAGLATPPRLFISLSAMGYYGNRPAAEPMTEAAAPGTGFMAEVCVHWEAAATPAAAAGMRVVHPRVGNVLTRKGGILPALLPVFRLGLGARFGSGEQIWPWISLEDVTAALAHVVAHTELAGPVNFVAPQATSNAEFTTALAAAVHRPAFLVVPGFAARLAPGGMGDEVLLAGARVVPARLLASGYVFRHAELKGALAAALH
jgi:uncharacterized protein (TIGR01777 family)